MARRPKEWEISRDASALEIISKKERIKPKTKNHELYLDAIDKSVLTICVGSAGTGKSYMAVGKASQMLQDRQIERVILTRPMVQCRGDDRDDDDDGIGLLPGEVDDKIGPYIRPLRDAFNDFMTAITLESYMKESIIEMVPLELMRGFSIKNSLVVCDEAQNASMKQLIMLMTRIDYGSKFVITGDIEQSDSRKKRAACPLMSVIEKFSKDCHKDISIVEMTDADVMRPEIVRWIGKRLS